MVKRDAWLSVTPEPERELPEAVATLIHGRRPPPEAIARERRRIEQLVLHGTERRWLGYLHGVLELAESRAATGNGELARARARVVAVLENHHQLLLGLPGRGARMTATDRRRLEELRDESRARVALSAPPDGPGR